MEAQQIACRFGNAS